MLKLFSKNRLVYESQLLSMAEESYKNTRKRVDRLDRFKESNSDTHYLNSELNQIKLEMDRDNIIKGHNQIIFKRLTVLNNIIYNLEENLIDKDIIPHSCLKCINKGAVLVHSFSETIISELLNSVSSNVKNTSAPLSNEIFELKKENSNLLGSLELWKRNLTDVNSENNYNKVLSSFSKQNSDFKDLGIKIDEDFSKIIESFSEVSRMFKKIEEDTFMIVDIASNIKNLSINASIEAARAGHHGKGFKVIALGTKKLSEQTHVLLESIVNKVKTTQKTIEETNIRLYTDVKDINRKIEGQNVGYERFYGILDDFYRDFDTVFDDTSASTDVMNRHIEQITPMLQLHDAIEQKMSNIARIIKAFEEKYRTELNRYTEELTDVELDKHKNDVISLFESFISTDSEVDIIGDFVKKHGLTRNNKIEIVENDFELF